MPAGHASLLTNFDRRLCLEQRVHSGAAVATPHLRPELVCLCVWTCHALLIFAAIVLDVLLLTRSGLVRAAVMHWLWGCSCAYDSCGRLSGLADLLLGARVPGVEVWL